MGGDKMTDRTAKLGNFFDDTATEKGIFNRSGQEYSLNISSKRFVGVSHLLLFLEI
jgi:hypothetical protein